MNLEWKQCENRSFKIRLVSTLKYRVEKLRPMEIVLDWNWPKIGVLE